MPTVLLNSWPITASIFDGDEAAGPVPSLFCDDPDAAKEAIAASVAKAHHDVQKISRVFFAGETVRLQDCQALLKKARY